MQPQTGTRSRQVRDHTATIQLKDLELVLVSAKMRRRNHGATCLLAAWSERLAREVDCHRRNVRPADAQAALRAGLSSTRCGLMDRGHIASLMQRTQLMRGGNEVRRTWGAGIRALLADPKFTLYAGRREA